MKSLLLFLILGGFSAVSAHAENIMALFLKAPWPADGFVLYLINAGADDVPLTSVSVGAVPRAKDGDEITEPTTREHIELGPGRVIPAGGISSPIALKRITNPPQAAKIIVRIQSGARSVQVDKVIIERPE